jgi:hypothetical protein
MPEIDSLISQLSTKLDEKTNQDDEALVKDCDVVLEMILVEWRALPPESRPQYKEAIRTFRRQIQQLKNNLEWQGNARLELTSSSQLDDASSQIQYGRQLQQEDTRTLQQIASRVEDAHQIGQAVVVKIAQQSEQIAKMHGDLYEINDTLSRSRKILRYMLRRTAQSRLVWFLVLAILIVIGLVLYFKFR